MSCIGSATILGLTDVEILKIHQQTADLWQIEEPEIFLFSA